MHFSVVITNDSQEIQNLYIKSTHFAPFSFLKSRHSHSNRRNEETREHHSGTDVTWRPLWIHGGPTTDGFRVPLQGFLTIRRCYFQIWRGQELMMTLPGAVAFDNISI